MTLAHGDPTRRAAAFLSFCDTRGAPAALPCITSCLWQAPVQSPKLSSLSMFGVRETNGNPGQTWVTPAGLTSRQQSCEAIKQCPLAVPCALARKPPLGCLRVDQLQALLMVRAQDLPRRLFPPNPAAGTLASGQMLLASSACNTTQIRIYWRSQGRRNWLAA